MEATANKIAKDNLRQEEEKEDLRLQEEKEATERLITAEFIRSLDSLASRIPLEFRDDDYEVLNTTFICDNNSILEAIVDCLREEHKIVLLNVVKLRRPQFKVASANAITILNFSSYSFAGMDLEGIYIEGANLSVSDFSRTNLSGSNMKGVNLSTACLEFANLCNCDLQEVIWEIPPLKGGYDHVRSVSFSPDGRYLASCSYSRTIRIWDLQNFTNEPKNTLKDHSDMVNSVTFSPDGRYLASCSGYPENTVRVWDLQNSTNELKNTLKGHSNSVLSVSFSPDGRYLVL